MALLMHSFVYLVLIFLICVFAVLANVASYWTEKHKRFSGNMPSET